jgi:hypothetical protein
LLALAARGPVRGAGRPRHRGGGRGYCASARQFLRRAVEFCNDRLYGTLSVNIIIHPATRARLGADFDRAIAGLRYGGIGINAWAGAAFLLPRAAWGAYPGHTYTDVQSGIGVVHNALMFDKPLKTVVSAPFRPFPRSVLHGEFTMFPQAAMVHHQQDIPVHRPETHRIRRRPLPGQTARHLHLSPQRLTP